MLSRAVPGPRVLAANRPGFLLNLRPGAGLVAWKAGPDSISGGLARDRRRAPALCREDPEVGRGGRSAPARIALRARPRDSFLCGCPLLSRAALSSSLLGVGSRSLSACLPPTSRVWPRRNAKGRGVLGLCGTRALSLGPPSRPPRRRALRSADARPPFRMLPAVKAFPAQSRAPLLRSMPRCARGKRGADCSLWFRKETGAKMRQLREREKEREGIQKNYKLWGEGIDSTPFIIPGGAP